MAAIELTDGQREALRRLAEFPLVSALYGRRSRRFPLGGEIPDGPLAYRSQHDPVPLTELERLLVLTACAGTTGWHYAIMRHAREHLAPYKRVRRLEFAELPKTISGKIRRVELRTQEEQGDRRDSEFREEDFPALKEAR